MEKPKLAWTQIPTMTHSRWGRVEVSAPPRWCSERPREGQEGALSALVSCHHLTPAVGPADGAGGCWAHPPSTPCPLRGPLAGSSTGCHLAVADLRGGSLHFTSPRTTAVQTEGIVGINWASSRTPSQARPLHSGAVSPSQVLRGNTLLCSDVTCNRRVHLAWGIVSAMRRCLWRRRVKGN